MMIAGSPSTRNMNRQPSRSNSRRWPCVISHADSGDPTAEDSGTATMNSATALARSRFGNQKVR